MKRHSYFHPRILHIFVMSVKENVLNRNFIQQFNNNKVSEAKIEVA